MAFTGTFMCNSFKTELMQGIHNFGPTTPDTFRIALYTSAATINASTTTYGGTVGSVPDTNEVSGTGYTAGGNALTILSNPTLDGAVAYIDFDDSVWNSATITAAGALIFNATDANRAVAVLDFSGDKTSTAGDFTIQFPVPNGTTGIIRIA